jgi:acetyltransferase-like isoleucine patch superfamily enzyme
MFLRARRLLRLSMPILTEVRHRAAFVPGPFARRVYAGAFHANTFAREAFEWAYGALVATPTFLSICAVHGKGVMVDQVPYVYGTCRLEVGSGLRITGKISIQGSVRGEPVLRIGDGVYLGHGCAFGIAERVEIGNYVSVGGGTYVSDTMGHSHGRLDVPIWRDPGDARAVAPVVIEDNVHIGIRCVILKGVRIGARSIIGAGALVRGDVPPDSIVAGNPARVAGWRKNGSNGAVEPLQPASAIDAR